MAALAGVAAAVLSASRGPVRFGFYDGLVANETLRYATLDLGPATLEAALDGAAAAAAIGR